MRRKGFEPGFRGPRLLVPRGVETSQTRLRASYTEDKLTFQHIIQAIVVPRGSEPRAKLLAALLNSRVAVWFAFHGTSSFGSDRPEVQQAELLHLPFPSVADLPEPDKAADAEKKLIAVIDEAVEAAKQPPAPALEISEENILTRIDRLAYQYFCLSDDEVVLIDDTVEKVIPAVQPHEGSYPEIWNAPGRRQRQAYAETLAASVSQWLRLDGEVSTQLEAASSDLAVLRLRLDGHSAGYNELSGNSVTDVLARISNHIHQPLDGNFQIIPDLRIFVGDNLYLIKPMQQRFWLKSTALADADAIAMDLQDTIELNRRQSQA